MDSAVSRSILLGVLPVRLQMIILFRSKSVVVGAQDGDALAVSGNGIVVPAHTFNMENMCRRRVHRVDAVQCAALGKPPAAVI